MLAFSTTNYGASGDELQSTLRLGAYDGKYTNLALLLSDQCEHTVKVAVFDGLSNTEFRDAKEFNGSLFRQIEDTYTYLEHAKGTCYPKAVLYEGLVNAIAHRDYSFSSSIVINVNNDCIEFISPGGLASGLLMEDIRSGISHSRNKKLIEIFYKLDFMKSYGTGIRKISNLYKDYPAQPSIEITPNTFKLILPNMNAPEKAVDSHESENRPDIVVKITPYENA